MSPAAGRWSTPWRASTTRSLYSTPGSPASTRAKPNSRWLQLDFDRAAKLVVTNDVPREVYDRRQAELLASRATSSRLWPTSDESALLRIEPASDEADLGQVAEFSSDFFLGAPGAGRDGASAAQLGVIDSFDEGPGAMVEAFEKEGDVNTTFARLAADAPDVKQAEAKLEVAKRDLAQAELDLKYCDVVR